MNTQEDTFTPPVRRSVGGVKGFTSNGLHYVMLKLDCGHVTAMPMKDREYECVKCGRHVFAQQSAPKCECGAWHYKVLGPIRDEWNEAEWNMPESCPCSECAQEAKDLASVPALVAKSVHSRFRPFGDGGYITFYAQDSKSPTGVLACGGVKATKAVEELIRSINSSISPLSPTEGLMRGLR